MNYILVGGNYISNIHPPSFISLLEGDDSLKIGANNNIPTLPTNLVMSYPSYPPPNNHHHPYHKYYQPPHNPSNPSGGLSHNPRNCFLNYNPHHLMSPKIHLIISTRITNHAVLHHLVTQIIFRVGWQLYMLICTD